MLVLIILFPHVVPNRASIFDATPGPILIKYQFNQMLFMLAPDKLCEIEFQFMFMKVKSY
jgi:hypothetical protein